MSLTRVRITRVFPITANIKMIAYKGIWMRPDSYQGGQFPDVFVDPLSLSRVDNGTEVLVTFVERNTFAVSFQSIVFNLDLQSR